MSDPKKKLRGWYRAYEEMAEDPKFRVIAKKASTVVPGLRGSDAIAIWVSLLTRASRATDRGCIDGYDCESADDHFGIPDGGTSALVAAFEAKGMILGGRISKWEERQPKREDSSAERMSEKRKRDAMCGDVTQCDAMCGDVTQCDPRLDKTRLDKSTKAGEGERARAQAPVQAVPPPPASASPAPNAAVKLPGPDQDDPSDPTVCEVPTAGGGLVRVSEYTLDAQGWLSAYPGIDVRQELQRCVAKLLSCPDKRPSSHKALGWCNSWLSNAQKDAQRPQAPPGQAKARRLYGFDQAAMDEIARDILGTEAPQ